MKNALLFLTLMLQLSIGYTASSDPKPEKLEESHLPLTSDFDKAKSLAKAYNLPLVLVFTGSDWCPNSKKLLTILQEKEFCEMVKNSMIFVQVDFPEINTANRKTLESCFSLKERYKVEEFPELVMLTSDLEMITQLGFCQQNAKDFAQRLQSNMSQFTKLNEFIQGSITKKLSSALQSNYIKAKDLGSDVLTSKYIEKGMKVEEGIFFHLEKYSEQMARGISDEGLKKTILARDKKGHLEALLKLSLCEFQELSKKHPNDPDIAIKPLLEYAEKHGLEGESSLWKVHSLISKHLKAKGDFEKALVHAKYALKDAPENRQKELKKLIKYFSHEVIAQQLPEKLQVDTEFPSSLQ